MGNNIKNKLLNSEEILTNSIYILIVIGMVSALYAHFLLSFGGFNDLWYVDDRVYTYLVNFVFRDPAAFERLTDDVLAFMATEGYGAERLARFEFRYDYSPNYLVHAASIALIAETFGFGTQDLDYGSWLFVVYTAGIALGHMVCAASVAYAMWLARRSDFPAITCLAVAISIGAYFLLGNQGVLWRLFTFDGVEILTKTGLFLLSPGQEFDFYGITPRNAATFLVIGIVIARWLDRYTLSYGMILIASLTHATYGELLIVIFAGVDLVLRPAILRKPSIMVLILVVLGTGFARTQAWGAFDGASVHAVGLVAIVAVLAMGASPYGARLVGRLRPIAWLRTRPERTAEAILFLAGILASMAAALVLLTVSSDLSGKYIANEMTGRPLALIRIPLLMTLVLLVYPVVVAYGRRLLLAAMCGFAGYVLVFSVVNTFPLGQTWMLESEFRSMIEQSLAKAESDPNFEHDEVIFYYATACQLDGACNYLDLVLGKRVD